ncbi:hypothetical protein NITMOv2_1963 [Nitrospira moscoviensis]|uniref:Uncharacterized protein n=1 Tax=Nitrospira moscoviensis TaxID=42253 RepID=A0A0K2GBQ4_NITMO|nr:hypothetical protein NITMOv2_1963 [Nitrospira moscoviensis]
MGHRCRLALGHFLVLSLTRVREDERPSCETVRTQKGVRPCRTRTRHFHPACGATS